MNPSKKSEKKKNLQKMEKNLIEQDFKCLDKGCDGKFETRKSALRHHKKTKHSILGRMTYEVKYG